MATLSSDARSEAERRYPMQPNGDLPISRLAFRAGAEWQTSRPVTDEVEAALAQFDHGLAEHDRQVKAGAWDECLDAIEKHELNTEQARAGNPYLTGGELQR